MRVDMTGKTFALPERLLVSTVGNDAYNGLSWNTPKRTL